MILMWRGRTTLELPYGQDALIAKLLAINPNMVVVMQAGNPVEIGKWVNEAKAVVWTGYCGMEGGTALAEVLLGEVNPSGKLAETIPQHLEMTPVSVLGMGYHIRSLHIVRSAQCGNVWVMRKNGCL